MPWIEKPKKKRQPSINRDKRQDVYQTGLWKRMRLAKLREQPLCEVCMLEGRVKLAEHAHHLVSFMKATNEIERDRLAFDSNNLCSVCNQCHARIHVGDLKGCESLESIEKRIQEINK